MPKNEMKTLAMDPNIEPWARQPGETLKRYAQFCEYRDLGRQRTLRAVSDKLTLHDAYVRTVAAANHWRDRCEKFDLHRDELHQIQWLEQRRQAAEADRRMLDGFALKIVRRLETFSADELDPPDFIRALDVVMRHRRGLFGDPALTVAVTGQGGEPLTVQLAELAGMTPEKRRDAVLAMTDDVRRRIQAASGVDDDDE
jgi:hypothetical protein